VSDRLLFPIETASARWDHRYFDDVIGPEGCLLYRLMGFNGLLYVGISRNPVERWRKHRLTKPWWAEVHLIECEIYASEYLALVAEVKAIRTEAPRFNIRSAAVA